MEGVWVLVVLLFGAAALAVAVRLAIGFMAIVVWVCGLADRDVEKRNRKGEWTW